MIPCHKKFYFLVLVAIFSVSATSVSATKHLINFGGTLGFTYSPSTLANVHIGDTVEWTGDFSLHPLINVSVPTGASAISGPTDGTTMTYDYIVKVLGHYAYQCMFHGSIGMTGTFDVSGLGVHTAVPVAPSVEQNSPNPAMRMTHIPFTLTKPAQVAVRVVDEKGVTVKEITQHSYNSGRQMIMLDVTALTSGSYFYELIIDGSVTAKAMIVNH